MKRILCVLLLLCLFFSCKTHTTHTTEPLTIGDRVPDLELRNMLNYPESEVNLSNFKDKLVILEFIITTCGTCIKSIEHLQKLQEEAGEHVQIILVTHHPEDKVRKMINDRGWDLPISVNDSLVSLRFPHLAVPHQVWIYNSKVKAITHWQYANMENVNMLLNGEEVVFPLKQEDTVDMHKPLLTGTGNAKSLYHSAITANTNNGTGGLIRKDNLFRVYNTDIYQLYKEAFFLPTFPYNAFVKYEVSDSIKSLITGPKEKITGNYQRDKAYFEWADNYTFCYTIQFPEGYEVSADDYAKIMRKDLNSFFSHYIGITGTMERRNVRCLALIRTEASTKRFESNSEHRIFTSEDTIYRQLNYPLSTFLFRLTLAHKDIEMPIVDATGFAGNADLEITGGLHDLENVNAQLKNFGLQLEEKVLPQEILVIRETGGLAKSN